MAGHRKGLGKPTRHQSRQSRMDARLADAATPAERASAAFDRLRMTCTYMTDRNRAAQILLTAADYLITAGTSAQAEERD